MISPSFQSRLIQLALFSHTGLTAFILFAALWLPSFQAQAAAFPVPEVYYEQDIRLGNLRFGFAETAKLEHGKFSGGVIVPGKQVRVYLGPVSGVLPISLFHASILATLAVGFLGVLVLALFGKRKRNGG